MKNGYLAAFGIGLLLSACTRTQNIEEPAAFTSHGDTIVLASTSAVAARLDVRAIGTSAVTSTIHSPAIVEGVPTRLARISLPTPGRITRIFVRTGQSVDAGDPLFSIDAPDFMEAQKTYLSSLHECNMADIEHRRQQDLLTHDVGVRRDLEESERNLNVRRSELRNALSKLRMYGSGPDSVNIGQPLVVRAPVSGRVSAIGMVAGQFKNDPSEILMVVADLSEVWITADVKEQDIRFLHVGDEVTTTVMSYPGKEYTGHVLFIDDILDEATHSLKVRIAMPNPLRELKPGMFATATFDMGPDTGMVVPPTALFQQGATTYTWKEIGQFRFVRTPVGTGSTTSSGIVIRSGLVPTDRIIVSGGHLFTDVR